MAMTEPKTEALSRKMKWLIIALAALLVISAVALVGRVVYLRYFADRSATVVVPDNLIGEEVSTPSDPATPDVSPVEQESSSDGQGANAHPVVTLELFDGQPSDNEPFQVVNMLPGDREVRFFQVKVHHDVPVRLFFSAEVPEQTKKLGDILLLKVTHSETDAVLYEGSFSGVNGKEIGELLPRPAEKETIAYYRVEVSMPTSAGNEYQAALLRADFRWFVTDVGALVSPSTGDVRPVWLVFIGLTVSLLACVVLLLIRRRKKEDGRGED